MAQMTAESPLSPSPLGSNITEFVASFAQKRARVDARGAFEAVGEVRETVLVVLLPEPFRAEFGQIRKPRFGLFAGLECRAEALVLFFEKSFVLLEVRDIDPQTGPTAVRCGTFNNPQPAPVTELLLDDGVVALVLRQPLLQPLFFAALCLCVLTIPQAELENGPECRSGNHGLGTLGIELFVLLVADHETIVLVIQDKTVGHRVDSHFQHALRPPAFFSQSK
jgi:hypothetical protein